MAKCWCSCGFAGQSTKVGAATPYDVLGNFRRTGIPWFCATLNLI